MCSIRLADLSYKLTAFPFVSKTFLKRFRLPFESLFGKIPYTSHSFRFGKYFGSLIAEMSHSCFMISRSPFIDIAIFSYSLTGVPFHSMETSVPLMLSSVKQDHWMAR